jgi:hypothetical protein
MLAVAANEGLELRQFDISTEFVTAISSTRSTFAPHADGSIWLVVLGVCFAWNVLYMC